MVMFIHELINTLYLFINYIYLWFTTNHKSSLGTSSLRKRNQDQLDLYRVSESLLWREHDTDDQTTES